MIIKSKMNKSVGATTDLYKSPREDYEFLNFLGKGAFGQVFRVRKLHGKDKNNIYAIKSMCKYFIVGKSGKSVAHAVSELNVSRSLKHPFLVELMYVFQNKENIYFVLEYLSGGTLYELQKKKVLFSEPDASFYMKELILAVEYLHSKNIIHRDIKTHNVLLESNGHIKLTDFGLSKDLIYDEGLTRSLCGTPSYMAPEIGSATGYGKAVDWWALGVLLYKLVVGYNPFIRLNGEDLRLKISKGKFVLPKRISLQAKDLITKLIKTNPFVRLGSSGAQEIKNHKFFHNTSWNSVLQRLETPPFVPNVGICTRVNDMQRFRANTPTEIILDSKVRESVHAKNNDVFKEFNFVNPMLM